MLKTYRHAGDAGDLCYFMAIIKHLGRGVLCIEAANYTRVRMTPERYAPLVPLLMSQDYIEGVREWKGEPVDVNGNDFRALLFKSLRMGAGKDTALIDWMIRAHNLSPTIKDKPWLTVEPKKIARVVFNRTGAGRPQANVYHNPNFPWHAVYQKYGKEAVFIGLEEEYHVFKRTCADVPHYKTGDLLEAAQVIAGCDLFIGNQSLPHALAEGMKKRIVLEVWREGPNCLHHRPGVVHGWDHNIELPDL